MIKIGDRVRHFDYGEGEVITEPNDAGELTVFFEKEFQVTSGNIIDTGNHFEDNTRLESINAIQVNESELSK
ncbi:hypothetical protein [Salibacterium aidingense]|uniref:hypothetical protein n=1 Tax=Salibacterium aidingense TaxID=384933 RepID=UPI0004271CED|nr:hypothetical protein [Salibacterium aidingense]